MKYLLEVTESYRVEQESEVNALVEEAKSSTQYELVKYSCVQKDKKQKGEIVESWFRVTLTKRFNLEKEPEDSFTNISYTGLKAKTMEEFYD